MSNAPRRSSRLLQHPGQQQLQATQSSPDTVPTFTVLSQNSSATTTSRPSPSNDDLNIPQQAQQPRLQLQSQFLNPPFTSTAPLPSPSSSDINPFFGRSQAQQLSFMGRQEVQNNMPQSQSNGFGSQQIQNQPQHAQHHNSFSQIHRPNVHHSSSEQVPPGLPPDFLAEAAKRAQMACLMRDLGDVSL